MASDVFISYASEDRERAGRVAAALSAAGWSVWWDRHIPPGRSFDAVIEEAIDAAACIVVLWSRESVASDWVKTEAAEGARRGVLVPVLLEAVRLPLEFRRIQAADLTDWGGDAQHPEFVKLANAVARLVPAAAEAPAGAGAAPAARPAAAAEPAIGMAPTETAAARVADGPGAAARGRGGRWIAVAAIALALALAGVAAVRLWPAAPHPPEPAGAASGPAIAAASAADPAGSAAADGAASAADPGAGVILVTVPPLVGETISGARTRVRELGLEPSISYRDSTGTTTGQVMLQRPAPGTAVTRGSVVALVVARPPAPLAASGPANAQPAQPAGEALGKWRRETDDWIARTVRFDATAQAAYAALVADRRRASEYAETLAQADTVVDLRNQISSAGGVAKRASVDSNAAARSARGLPAGWPTDESGAAMAAARRITGEAKTLAGTAESAASTVAQQRDVIHAATERMLAIRPEQARMALCNANANNTGLTGDARRRFVADCLRSN